MSTFWPRTSTQNRFGARTSTQIAFQRWTCQQKTYLEGGSRRGLTVGVGRGQTAQPACRAPWETGGRDVARRCSSTAGHVLNAGAAERWAAREVFERRACPRRQHAGTGRVFRKCLNVAGHVLNAGAAEMLRRWRCGHISVRALPASACPRCQLSGAGRAARRPSNAASAMDRDGGLLRRSNASSCRLAPPCANGRGTGGAQMLLARSRCGRDGTI